MVVVPVKRVKRVTIQNEVKGPGRHRLLLIVVVVMAVMAVMAVLIIKRMVFQLV